MSKYHSFEKLAINYDTGPIPPPFCHKYSISVQTNGDFRASLKLEYYDRDEITEEEIFDEGFSLEDDFSWEGKMPEIWKEVIIDRLSGTNWLKKNKDEIADSLIRIKVTEKGQSELLIPADNQVWEILAQDIIQAIFELAKKEAPLNIQFVVRDEKSNQTKLDLHYQFANRKVIANSTDGKSQSLDWKEGQKLLQYIFYFDFLPEESLDGSPQKKGSYIFPGDGYWYQLDNDMNGELELRKQKLINALKTYI